MNHAHHVKTYWGINTFNKVFEGEYNSRILEYNINNLEFITPNYIPSFSSRDDPYIKERINELLDDIPQSTVLISAYDYYELKNKGSIYPSFIKKSFKDKLLFLDSGGYELQFSTSNNWTPERYRDIIRELTPQFFVGFDRIPSYKFESNTMKEIEESMDFLKSYTEMKGRVLLIHFSMLNNPINEIPKLVSKIIEHSDYIDVLGFPEREIGTNIIQSCRYIRQIRKELDKREIFKPIHIFGCSDPKSIILFVLSGADIFDGLGWIKYAFNEKELKNDERSHFALFNCNCNICKSVNWSEITAKQYEYYLLMHNLYSYENFLYNLRSQIIEETLDEYLIKAKLDVYLKKIF